MKIRLVKKMVEEGQVIDKELAGILLNEEKVVDTKVVDKASGGSILEVWYLKTEKE